MSYSIWIGQAVVKRGDEGQFYVSVEERKDDRAPRFDNDEMTGRTNGRHPSYGGWDEFTRVTGLHDLFFDKENGLMREHPGVFSLKTSHLNAVKRAYRGWEPSGDSGFGPEQDPILARLQWLDFWMVWALNDCVLPAIGNS